MKAIAIICALATGCAAVTVNEPGMMMDMMYMQFWSGTMMNFLFMNAMSDTTTQFLLGLAVCFIGAVAYEILQHKRAAFYKGAIVKLASHQAADA